MIDTAPDRLRPVAVGLFRVIVGLLFACHGIATLFDVLGGPRDGAVPALLAWPGWWASVIQMVAGLLVALGLGTRGAALIGSGSMAYAYFSVHQAHALLPIQNGGEPSVMFCWSLLILAIVGPGAYAMDSLVTGLRSAPGRRVENRTPSPAAEGVPQTAPAGD